MGTGEEGSDSPEAVRVGSSVSPKVSRAEDLTPSQWHCWEVADPGEVGPGAQKVG